MSPLSLRGQPHGRKGRLRLTTARRQAVPSRPTPCPFWWGNGGQRILPSGPPPPFHPEDHAMTAARRRLRLAVFVSTVCLALPWLARGDDAGPVGQLRPRMQAFVDHNEVAGLVAVVGRHDAILAVEAMGLADIEKHRPMTRDAIFRIASMTKPVTAVGVMILVDEGKLAIEDAVEKHLPEFRGQMLVAARDEKAGTVTLKKPARPITVRDLLTHT